MIVEHAWLLWLALPLALGAWAAAAAVRRRRIARAGRWSPELAAQARGLGRRAPWVLGAAALLIGIGAAGPRWGRQTVTAQTKSLSVVFAVDISRSMLAEDVSPSRLRRAGEQVRRLLQDLAGDRVGLIAFSGRSYILSPLTVDGGAVRIFVDALDPDLASEGGTTLGLPLGQGGELLAASESAGDRVLVVFTDGEAHDSLADAVARAKQLKDAGVHLVMVAEGTTTPTRLPVRDSVGRFLDWQVDADGQQVRSARSDETLRAIVDAAEGTLIRADVPDQAGAIRDLLATYLRGAGSETRAQDFVPRAWIPALAAALLLLGYGFLRRGLALAVLALCVLSVPAAAQRPTTATRLAEDGDATRALAAFLREAREPSARDTALYNAGTAALKAQKYDDARKALGEAAKTLDPALRYRALYNAGVAALLAARGDSAHRDTLLGEAEGRLRSALLLEPGSERAKWNLELALRQKPPPKSGGGGGGGGGTSSQQSPPPPQPKEDQMNKRQADQILESMERAERDTRLAQQRRAQGRAGGVKDW